MVTVGIDEVGRGCWAGPLVAAAVVLGTSIDGLDDSKKLTKKHREELDEVIHRSALAIGIGWVRAKEIDQIGLTAAVKQAMEQALAEVKVPYDEIIIDGNINYLSHNPKAKAVVKADGSMPAVSAASIIAKVARDEYMAGQVHAQFPQYAFDMHVGYGTKLHTEMLKLHGVTPLHRKSYKPIQALL